MGRPAEFDPDDVLDRAMEAFWLRGFEHTSIVDLVQATGVGRSSLYGRWGDKHGLFLAALHHYGVTVRSTWLARLDHPDALTGVRDLFRGLEEAVRDDPVQRGCFALNTALELGRRDPIAQAAVRELLDGVQAGFEAALVRARDAGRLPADLDTTLHARHLAVAMQALLLQSRNGAPPETLAAFVDLTLQTLPEVHP